MGQRYIVNVSAVAVSAAQDVFELNVASDRSVILHEIGISQYSDAGDAQAELLSVQLITGYTTSGSGGSTPTPAHLQGTVSASSTVEANNTTVANTGTAKTLLSDSWNVQIPYLKLWTPETRPEFKASTRAVVRITAPADAITLNGYMIFEEIGA